MASEVFLKISKATASMFIIDDGGEPNVQALIRHLTGIRYDLEDKQKLHVYEGIGHMIKEEKNLL